MTNKEELKKRFETIAGITTQKETHQEYINRLFNFFWNEIEHIRKSDMERFRNEWNSYVDRTVEPKHFNQEWLKAHMKNFLSIIKQDEK